MLSLPERGAATRLVLLRHAETDESMRGRCYGSLDVPLSAAGLRRAAALGLALRELGAAVVYSSPLVRALDTARAIASAQGLEPVVRPDLRELDFGELEGMTYDEIAAERPELYRFWMEDPASVRFPAGESLADLRERVLPALAEIRATHAGEAVVVVAHGGVVRVALADVLGIPDAAFFRLDQPPGGISVVDWLDGVPVVRVVNAEFLYSPP
ncbi:MAG: histidine phosphatase family protein [Gaiellaceae bacterium]